MVKQCVKVLKFQNNACLTTGRIDDMRFSLNNILMCWGKK